MVIEGGLFGVTFRLNCSLPTLPLLSVAFTVMVTVPPVPARGVRNNVLSRALLTLSPPAAVPEMERALLGKID